MPLDDSEISIVKGMLDRGDAQHHIAAYFGVNSARINDIKYEKNGIGSSVSVAPVADLPPPGPYLAGRSALKARETLTALRDLIDQTIAEIEVFEGAAEPLDGR